MQLHKLLLSVRLKIHRKQWLRKWLRYLNVEMPLFPSTHYHSTIVATQEILNNDFLFEHKCVLPGIQLNKKKQLHLLNELAIYYKDLPFHDHKVENINYYYDNVFFSYSDGIILYSILRRFNPQHIIEVGSGFSSACMIDTINHHFISTVKCHFVEPNPTRFYEVVQHFTSDYLSYQLLKSNIEAIPLSFFQVLQENDIFFVDSSHVVKTNNDLYYLLFTVLPSLQIGVVIHFHDIFDGFEYPKEWIEEGVNWNESYFIRAFLQYNDNFEILLFSAYMENEYTAWYQTNMPLCLQPHERYAYGKNKGKLIDSICGQSLWLKKIK